jgi:hypothetical protein
MAPRGGRTLVHLFDKAIAMSGRSFVAPKRRHRMGMHCPKQVCLFKVSNGGSPSAGAIRLKETSLRFTNQIRMP